MAPEQFEADKNYLAAREIAEGFLKKGLLTADEFDKAVVGVEPVEKLHTVVFRGEPFAFEIFVLLCIAKVIDQHNVVEIIGIQAAHHTTADEARGSCNCYHLCFILESDCKFKNFWGNGELRDEV